MDSKKRDEKRKSRGKAGEQYVSGYLRDNGYDIACMNYSSRYGEIDVIAENEKYIAFIEVKTRKQGSVVSGLECINGAKIKKMIRTAADYLSKHNTKKQPRIDCAQVEVNNSSGEVANMVYIENAVDDWSGYLI